MVGCKHASASQAAQTAFSSAASRHLSLRCRVFQLTRRNGPRRQPRSTWAAPSSAAPTAARTTSLWTRRTSSSGQVLRSMKDRPRSRSTDSVTGFPVAPSTQVPGISLNLPGPRRLAIPVRAIANPWCRPNSAASRRFSPRVREVCGTAGPPSPPDDVGTGLRRALHTQASRCRARLEGAAAEVHGARAGAARTRVQSPAARPRPRAAGEVGARPEHVPGGAGGVGKEVAMWRELTRWRPSGRRAS